MDILNISAAIEDRAAKYEVQTGKTADTMTISCDLWHRLTEPFRHWHTVTTGNNTRTYCARRVILTTEHNVLELFHSVNAEKAMATFKATKGNYILDSAQSVRILMGCQTPHWIRGCAISNIGNSSQSSPLVNGGRV